MKIIPSINTETFEEAKKRIDLLKNITQDFHIDIASLDFTNHQTWQNPKNLDLLDMDLKIQLHLMVYLKPMEILKWNNSRVKTFILHFEACNLPFALLKFAKKTKKEIIIAWTFNIDEEFIKEFLNYVNGILVLGVKPGKSGQEFLEKSYENIGKACKFKEKYKNLKIFIDGGINKTNIKEFKNFLIDYIIIGKAIFEEENPLEAYKYFASII